MPGLFPLPAGNRPENLFVSLNQVVIYVLQCIPKPSVSTAKWWDGRLGPRDRDMVKSQQIPRTCKEFPVRSTPLLPPNASAGKRWRFRRNMVIFVAHRNGLSQRLLADVFDLPRSSVAEVIRTFGEYEINLITKRE